MSGRGGAGNIEAANQAASQELKASQDYAEKGGLGPAPIDDVLQQEREQQQYAHSGRGGAGNYFSPKVLAQTGAFSTPAKSPTAGDDSSLRQAAEQVTYVGRGGAGNFKIDAQTLGTESTDTAEDPSIRAAIDRDLEKGLPQEPQAAHLRRDTKGQDEGFQDEGNAEALDAAAR